MTMRPMLAGLLAELHLLDVSLSQGRKTRLFAAGGESPTLTVVEAKTFSTGVVHLTDMPGSR
jgi:hypothetical protein